MRPWSAVTGLSLPYELLKRERALLARFVVASLSRGALASVWILLVRTFLFGIVGQPQGVAGRLTDVVGRGAALWMTAGLIALVQLATAILALQARVTEQRIVAVVELGTMDRVMRHLLGLSLSFFDERTHGELMESLRRDVANLRTATLSVASLWIETAQGLGLVIAAAWISPSLAFWAFLVVPVSVLPFLFAAKPTLVGAFAERRSSVALFNRMLQVLQGIRVVKVYQREAAEADGALLHAQEHLSRLLGMERVRAAASVGLDALGGLSVALVIVVGGFQVMDGRIAWPGLLAFLIAARAIQTPLSNIGNAYLEIQRHGASVAGIQALLAEPSESVNRSGARALDGPVESLALHHVVFRRDGNTLLDDVTVEVCAGETLGVVGASGAGKTTLLNLLARGYDPTSGEVRLSGIDMRDLGLADVRSVIALVPQDPFLFAASIEENIRCGRQDASREAVEAAARAAGIHDEIADMPDGYATIVGHGGRTLSRGEAQRLNIARAFLKDAPILLLDEPTSSLDPEAEARVQGALDKLIRGRISVAVAHRLWTVRDATRILVLEGGRVAGLGTHPELMRNCAVYRRLCEAQPNEEGRAN